MSMNISGLGNTYNGINTNSKQYKALKEKGWLSGIMQNEAMMSAEERLIYETFGGRDTIIKNLMKQFDSDGDLLNANGVAGMDVTGKGTSWQQLTSVSEEYRQKMFDNVKREFIKENGIEDENPSLFEQCVEYLEYTLYALYPQDIYEEDCHVLAAAIHYYVATLQSMDIDLNDLEVMYYCDKSEIEQRILALKQIEC